MRSMVIIVIHVQAISPLLPPAAALAEHDSAITMAICGIIVAHLILLSTTENYQPDVTHVVYMTACPPDLSLGFAYPSASRAICSDATSPHISSGVLQTRPAAATWTPKQPQRSLVVLVGLELSLALRGHT